MPQTEYTWVIDSRVSFKETFRFQSYFATAAREGYIVQIYWVSYLYACEGIIRHHHALCFHTLRESA
ncbi:hypothetical protein D1093_08505 [Bartonella kosoyi]|uniref:Uncharacterized protein n=1 Tax=Bartonella kosoyi TaxID=2133959 RepID=A0A5B9CYT6_9HYPH|nr:hypothetical protein [Bartonella kosoyi]QEE09626.1 hypothetical protein D1093_08505 [Bartonella kosoyi]